MLKSLAFLLLGVAGSAPNTEMKAALDLHNSYRCMHAVPNLAWDDKIAANAQKWADNGQFKHSGNSDREIDGEQCGENLAWGSPSRTASHSTKAWYDEIDYTSPKGLATSMSDSKPANKAIGHYTQVVWKGSTKIGCGKGKANGGDFIVCQYCPAGNYVGQFSANVLAPTVTSSKCSTKSSGGGSGSHDHGGSGGGSTGSKTGGTGTSLSKDNCPAPADGSRGRCESCFHKDQCRAGMYCCPYMKKCVETSKTGCMLPIADCKPMCHDSKCDKATGCSCTCTKVPSTHGWLEWANMVNSATSKPEKKVCPKPAGGSSKDGGDVSNSQGICRLSHVVLLATVLVVFGKVF